MLPLYLSFPFTISSAAKLLCHSWQYWDCVQVCLYKEQLYTCADFFPAQGAHGPKIHPGMRFTPQDMSETTLDTNQMMHHWCRKCFKAVWTHPATTQIVYRIHTVRLSASTTIVVVSAQRQWWCWPGSLHICRLQHFKCYTHAYTLLNSLQSWCS